jgi:hypothetical protein
MHKRTGEFTMNKLVAFAVLFVLLPLAGSTRAYAQSVDLAFGAGSLTAPSAAIRNGLIYPSETGGAYLGFSGDVLVHKRFGVGAEIAWRAGQNQYGTIGPYRPLFFDVNGVWAPQITKHLTGELQAGIGVEDIRFYTASAYSSGGCGFYGYCNDYISSHHFMGDFGAGIRAYIWHNAFVRPEVRLYLINNNAEFSSGIAFRYGASLGYSFGR